MKTLATLTIIIMAILTGTVSAETINFDDTKPGQLPAGWSSGKTGSGNPRWTVEKDDSAPSKPNVLKQSGQATYCLAVKSDTNVKDGFAEVKFKPISGKEDQAAGLVWRYRDENNYYVVRANALEGNVVLYKTQNGKRSSLDIVGRKGGYGVKADVPKQSWSTLRVEFSGSRFTVSLNGKQLFEVEEVTFSDAGKVGLWTKADSVTLFDDFSYGSK
jgi:3-keto-disaccharide hydrolase